MLLLQRYKYDIRIFAQHSTQRTCEDIQEHHDFGLAFALFIKKGHASMNLKRKFAIINSLNRQS